MSTVDVRDGGARRATTVPPRSLTLSFRGGLMRTQVPRTSNSQKETPYWVARSGAYNFT